MGTRILIADDDPIHRRNIETMVQRLGYRTILTDGGIGAFAFAAQRKDIALILLDMAMPDMDGLGVLARMREAGIVTPVIVLVRSEDMNRALQAIKLGAVDFVTVPVTPERIQLSLSNALKLDALTHEVRRNRSLRSHFSLSDIIAKSPDMERTLIAARRAAALDAPLLLEGEAGCGKETLARAICGNGGLRRGPFIAVDCRKLTSANVETVLFGMPDADGSVGKLAAADGGTLFLDEVGALPRYAQMKLFTAMQTGQYETDGVQHAFTARVMASTTQSLTDLVHMGRFHPGLSQMLASYLLSVPALRNRREDIPMLLHHFTMRFASEERRGHITGVSPHVQERLRAYHWPGNVREMKNAVFRAVLLCETSELTMADFGELTGNLDGWPNGRLNGWPDGLPGGQPDDQLDGLRRLAGLHALEQGRTSFQGGLTADKANSGIISGINADGEVRTLAAAEEEMIRFAISHYDGQISEVARRLGIGRTTLYRKLKEYGIDVTSISGKAMEERDGDENTPWKRLMR